MDSVSTVGASWEDTDDLLHINVLELTAACLALDTLTTAAQSTHIQLKLDNLTAITYINKMGGTHSHECNRVTPCALIPTAYVSPVIDLFASSANAKLPRYISWLPDPHAYAVDAFNCSLAGLNLLCFSSI